MKTPVCNLPDRTNNKVLQEELGAVFMEKKAINATVDKLKQKIIVRLFLTEEHKS
ncbi:MAG: hypothetical protein J6X49_08325 [Victivallales bacterium]|nr:hypothetical protein [Victivallales bacterium]